MNVPAKGSHLPLLGVIWVPSAVRVKPGLGRRWAVISWAFSSSMFNRPARTVVLFRLNLSLTWSQVHTWEVKTCGADGPGGPGGWAGWGAACCPTTGALPLNAASQSNAQRNVFRIRLSLISFRVRRDPGCHATCVKGDCLPVCGLERNDFVKMRDLRRGLRDQLLRSDLRGWLPVLTGSTPNQSARSPT